MVDWPLDEFVFGAATAAFQVEGGLDHISDYGVYASIPDGPFVGPAGDACDHYRRFTQDIELLAELGLTTYRFSVEWARVETTEGVFNQEAIEHYASMIEACRANRVRPVVTLQHFTSPIWLIRQGGWESPDTPAHFGRYVERIVADLGGLLTGRENEPTAMMCTLNEVNTGCLNHGNYGPPYIRRKSPWVARAVEIIDMDPQRFTPWTFASSPEAANVIMSSHFRAAAAIKASIPTVPVGLTVASQAVEPVSEEFADQATTLSWFLEDQFLDALSTNGNPGDFVGVQAYKRTHIGRQPGGEVGPVAPAPGTRLVDLGYEFAPEAVGECADHTHDITGLPIVISECGVGAKDDRERVEYNDGVAKSIATAIDNGIPIKGMLAWSLLDNYEWEHAFGPKFGLVAVDHRTQERTVKPSARRLRKAFEAVGLPLEPR